MNLCCFVFCSTFLIKAWFKISYIHVTSFYISYPAVLRVIPRIHAPHAYIHLHTYIEILDCIYDIFAYPDQLYNSIMRNAHLRNADARIIISNYYVAVYEHCVIIEACKSRFRDLRDVKKWHHIAHVDIVPDYRILTYMHWRKTIESIWHVIYIIIVWILRF